MPTYTEAIKFEEAAPKGTIRLVRSGEFYRAYDHSAWLLSSIKAANLPTPQPEPKISTSFIR
ncbi:MAG: hypothetical protein LUC86_03325 [Prevotellaceae bacterium]|nr:hypothetical protein [Prevotellaceae bacterium]